MVLVHIIIVLVRDVEMYRLNGGKKKYFVTFQLACYMRICTYTAYNGTYPNCFDSSVPKALGASFTLLFDHLPPLPVSPNQFVPIG